MSRVWVANGLEGILTLIRARGEKLSLPLIRIAGEAKRGRPTLAIPWDQGSATLPFLSDRLITDITAEKLALAVCTNLE